MKRTTAIDLICAVLLCFYLFTAINSFFQVKSLQNLLAFYTIHTSEVAWTMVSTETCISLLLFFRRTRVVGLLAGLSMLVYAGIMIKQYPHFPHEFGGLFNFLNTRQEWYMITLLCSLSVIAFALILVERGSTNDRMHHKPQLT